MSTMKVNYSLTQEKGLAAFSRNCELECNMSDLAPKKVQ